MAAQKSKEDKRRSRDKIKLALTLHENMIDFFTVRQGRMEADYD